MHPTNRRVARFLAGILVLALAVPAAAEVTDEQVRRAREEVNALVADSADLGEQVQDAYTKQFALEDEIGALQESIEYARIQLAQVQERLEEVAVEMYMGSSSTAGLTVLMSSTDEDFEAASQYLQDVNGVEINVINELRRFRTELDNQTARLAEASEEQTANTAKLEELAAIFYADLQAAQDRYDELVETQAAEEEQRRIEEEQRRQEEEQRRQEEERRRQEAAATSTTVVATTSSTAAQGATTTTSGSATTTAPANNTTTTAPPPPPPTSGGGACPVAGAVQFSNTWGDARSGGRSHQGVDMMAVRGTHVAAIFSGTVTSMRNNNLGGKTIWLRANGDTFYYAHLDSHAGGLSVGSSVSEGQIIGTVGSTGNASDDWPHLHFEYHPGGGSASNPYPLVKGICG